MPKPAATSAPSRLASEPLASVPATKATPAAVAPQAEPKPATPSLDLDALEQRLRDTKAIGVFTKLSLKNQVDDLLDEVRQYHRNPANPPQPVVRRQFEGLILKVLSSLQGGDPQLANTIAASREALWGILMDPDKFSKI
jgi:hypothetical protein